MARTRLRTPTTPAADATQPNRFFGSVSKDLEGVGIERVPETAAIRTRSLADDYQSTTEQINPLIARAEKALAALRLSVSASVVLESGEGWTEYLSFGKEDREWTLTTVLCGETDDDAQTLRLHASSRETRLRALALLPELEKKLVETAEEQKAQAKQVVDNAAAYIAALEARTK
jgi:hypothetical protein